MSNRRFVTLFLMALALVIQMLGPLLLEASKPNQPQVPPTFLPHQSSNGTFATPSTGAVC